MDGEAMDRGGEPLAFVTYLRSVRPCASSSQQPCKVGTFPAVQMPDVASPRSGRGQEAGNKQSWGLNQELFDSGP